MFELNLASLPNHILYLEGVQLSYIKVFVHIFSLWHSNKPCYLSTLELMKRTGLSRSTVYEALAFFEKKGVYKRVQKGTKRYLVQSTKYIETEIQAVDNNGGNSSNDEQGSEIADKGVRDSGLKGSELADHNIKYNTKDNKSSCASLEQEKPKPKDEHAEARERQRQQNAKRHSWGEEKKGPLPNVNSQSTSFDFNASQTPPPKPDSQGLKNFRNLPFLRRKYANEATIHDSQAEVRSQMAQNAHAAP